MASWVYDFLNALSGDLSPAAGEGLEVTFVHSWPWPPWATLLFLMTAAVYVVAIYLREPGETGRAMRLLLAAVRLTLIGLILTMMYGWMRNRYRTDLPDVIVAVDDSDSMNIADSYDNEALRTTLARRLRSVGLDQPTRILLAKMLLLENDARWLRGLDRRYNLKFYWLSTSARGTSSNLDELEQRIKKAQAAQPVSRLGRGLRDILETQRGRPTAAVIILTDGVTTEGKSIGEVAQYARRKGVPLYLVGLGEETPPCDVRVADLLVDDAIFLGDLAHFDFTVTGSGFTSEKVRILLQRKGLTRPLATETVILAGDGKPQRVRLSYRPDKEGEFEFSVEAEPLKNEVNPTNNRQTRVIRVSDETIRVLYVQEYPSFEFRFLKTLLERGLKRDGKGKAIQLTTVLQEADVNYVELDETAQRVFPVTRDALFAYDVVIFGDVNPSYLSRPVMDNLAAFVQERGGGLVVIAGPRHTPLAYRDTPLEPLFPINMNAASLPSEQSLLDESFRPRPTRLGMTTPLMQLADTPAASLAAWQRLPPIRWLLLAPETRPAARVLAEHPARTGGNGMRLPVICVQFVGAGKIIFHATDETYLWSRCQGSDQYYERYWLQTIRYLSRAKLLGTNRAVELTLNRSRHFRGEAVPLRVRFLDDRMAPATDDGVVVVVEREGGRRRKIKLVRNVTRRGVFEGAVGNLAEGSYRAWLATPTFPGRPPSRRFTVAPPPGERARMEMDVDDLRRAAETSQGKFYTIQSASRLLKDLPRGRQVRIESLPSNPVWNSPLLTGLFVGLLVTEWLLRRRVGWL